ncbi:hypothetical protein HYH03_012221 [Edaphochlamys debaryana]|uniref:Uncharacterized protein n=1 Tax=Edaphochlamys debaryana TaxID=47281 RepID=A0A835XSC0_9CHLO|nr:hypothetical protein HYH03_012221 [Edaphochlamys debaryana]|eukprot:KAG2489196.1 hypothetical protein HYH03_012221 [Edaphochlamys debaryana]
MADEEYAPKTIGNASSVIAEIDTENRRNMGIISSEPNAGQYDFFIDACRNAKSLRKADRADLKGDPHACGINDTYTVEQYAAMGTLLAGGQTTARRFKWTLLDVVQVQLFLHVMHFGAARGDDMRQINICDIGRPEKGPGGPPAVLHGGYAGGGGMGWPTGLPFSGQGPGGPPAVLHGGYAPSGEPTAGGGGMGWPTGLPFSGQGPGGPPAVLHGGYAPSGEPTAGGGGMGWPTGLPFSGQGPGGPPAVLHAGYAPSGEPTAGGGGAGGLWSFVPSSPRYVSVGAATQAAQLPPMVPPSLAVLSPNSRQKAAAAAVHDKIAEVCKTAMLQPPPPQAVKPAVKPAGRRKRARTAQQPVVPPTLTGNTTAAATVAAAADAAATVTAAADAAATVAAAAGAPATVTAAADAAATVTAAAAAAAATVTAATDAAATVTAAAAAATVTAATDAATTTTAAAADDAVATTTATTAVTVQPAKATKAKAPKAAKAPKPAKPAKAETEEQHWSYPELEGVMCIDDSFPWGSVPPPSFVALFETWYLGVPNHTAPWSTLYAIHKTTWYPKHIRTIHKRMLEFEHLIGVLKQTAIIRRCSERQAAEFWDTKLKLAGTRTKSSKTPALKPYWEQFLNLLLQSGQLEDYVRVDRPPGYASPAKDSLQQRLGRMKASGAAGGAAISSAGGDADDADVKRGSGEGGQPLRCGYLMFLSDAMKRLKLSMKDANLRWGVVPLAEKAQWNSRCEQLWAQHAAAQEAARRRA